MSDDKRIEVLLWRMARLQLEQLPNLDTHLAVLRRELLPLLLAGQALRDGHFATSHFPERALKETDAWDAALAGSEESDDGK